VRSFESDMDKAVKIGAERSDLLSTKTGWKQVSDT
jgi:hypothetical protein